MAESTSHASSGENEDGRPSVTAANKKKLNYVRDYLERLPKQKRKRIQKEIDEGFKPGQLE